MKLALGTAQFGLNYGINNTKGKILKKAAYEVLSFAYDKGIRLLDTACAYGDSQNVIGSFIKDYGKDFDIVSKVSPQKDVNIENQFGKILKNLNVFHLYGLLIHNFDSFLQQKRNIIDKLGKFKLQGKVKKIGFSLYHPKEIEFLLDNKYNIDIVQVPFNIFDQRFAKIFPKLKEKNIEVHIRSVFLQGLVFKKSDELISNFNSIKSKLSRLRAISYDARVPFSALCVNFAISNRYIDKVILGVDNISHLKENIEDLRYREKVKGVYNKLLKLKEDNESVILPVNWRKQ